MTHSSAVELLPGYLRRETLRREAPSLYAITHPGANSVHALAVGVERLQSHLRLFSKSASLKLNVIRHL